MGLGNFLHECDTPSFNQHGLVLGVGGNATHGSAGVIQESLAADMCFGGRVEEINDCVVNNLHTGGTALCLAQFVDKDTQIEQNIFRRVTFSVHVRDECQV